MATVQQIDDVKLNIDNGDQFTDAQIESKIDVHDSVNWASWQLIDIMIVRLSTSKDLKKDVTGLESTEFHSIKDQLDILQASSKKYKDAYNAEIGNSTGKYIATNKPCVAGGLN